MASASRRTLPERADLEQQRKLAKDLLAAFREGDSEAHARVRAELPDKERIVLSDAQFVLAREYGFKNWSELAAHIEALGTEPAETPVEQFKRAVRDGDARALRRVLERHEAARRAVNQPIFSFGSPAQADSSAVA